MDEFSITEYIQRSLLRVEKEEERTHLRTVLEGILIPLQEHMDKKYEQLTESIRKDLIGNTDGYEIYTSVIPRKDFNLGIPQLCPMDNRDLQEHTVEAKKVSDNLKTYGRVYLYQVVADCEYTIVQELKTTKRKFSGIIVTEEDEYAAVFEIKADMRYWEQVKELYCAFIDNGLEWKTICAPYLFRIFGVYLIETACPEEEDIKEIRVDFQEYEPVLLRDQIPVWNVDKIRETTSAYPVPSVARMYYNHVIYKHRLHGESKYLPAAGEVQIASLKNIDGDLVITCNEEEPINWELYEIMPRTEQICQLECFSNGLQKTGLEKHSMTNGIRTKGELYHFVSMLGYEEYMKLVNVSVRRNYETETYSMDPFLEDEIRTSGNPDTLVFHFLPNEMGRKLNYDIMSYLVSRIQWYYPDYHCVGTFQSFRESEERE